MTIPGFSNVTQSIGFPLPSPFGTFVVSHNYGLAASDDYGLRECSDGSSGDVSHPAQDGLNNLEKFSKIDHPRRRCYDTTPFRDQADYSESHYIKAFQARGKYFMGCKQAMADDPTAANNPATSIGDVNALKIDCEG